MTDFNQYVTSINIIFDYLSKMKAGWSSIDNINYIESIEEYKQIVASSAEKLKGTAAPAAPAKLEENNETDDKLEALGND